MTLEEMKKMTVAELRAHSCKLVRMMTEALIFELQEIEKDKERKEAEEKKSKQ